MKSKKKTICTF